MDDTRNNNDYQQETNGGRRYDDYLFDIYKKYITIDKAKNLLELQKSNCN